MKRYVKDIIGDDYLQWNLGEKVLISTPTGSGKTTFVLKSLLTHAVQEGKHVVYYCNRTALHDQFSVISEDSIRRMYKDEGAVRADKALEHLHIFTYQRIEYKETHPAVCVKDAFNEEAYPLWAEDIIYYIFDEAHYFLSDSTINRNTNFWLDPGYGCYIDAEKSISVYLTATPDPLFVFLCGSSFIDEFRRKNLHDSLKNEYIGKNNLHDQVDYILRILKSICNSKHIPMTLPSTNNLVTYLKDHSESSFQPFFEKITESISTHAGIDHVYPKQDDVVTPQEYYSYVKPVYFKEYEDLIEEIKGCKEEKWLIFIDNEDLGLEFVYALEKAGIRNYAFISRNRINKNKGAKKTYKTIVNEEYFSEQVLITTSVLDCGVNINDPQVKNVVISCSTKSSFLQMLGRKRVDEGEEIRLFIKQYTYQTIHNRYNNCRENLISLNQFSLKNVETPLVYAPNNPEYKKGEIFDSYKYGSLLSEKEFEEVKKSFNPANSWQSYIKPPKRTVAPHKYRGHVITTKESTVNIDNRYKEFQFSQTAYLHLLMQMQEYETALGNYHLYGHLFTVELLDFVQKHVSELRKIKKYEWPYYFHILKPPYHEAENLMFSFQRRGIEDTSFIIERSDLFFLNQQLAWIGKEYDESCWFRQPLEALRNYLESNLDNLQLDPKLFSEEVLTMLCSLPQRPNAIKQDISRYQKGKPLGQCKVNECFKELNMNYTVHSHQKQINKERKTYWYLKYDSSASLLKK